VEDPDLITGRGLYASDPHLEGLAHLVVFRSPFGRARIDRLSLDAARATPGVLAAWTAEDLPELAAGMGDLAPRQLTARSRPILASGETRYQGEALAAVVAESAYTASDTLELVEAELEPLPAVGTLGDALAQGAPRVHDDLESNVSGSITRSYGDVESAFGARLGRRLMPAGGAASLRWLHGAPSDHGVVRGWPPDHVGVDAVDVRGPRQGG